MVFHKASLVLSLGRVKLVFLLRKVRTRIVSHSRQTSLTRENIRWPECRSIAGNRRDWILRLFRGRWQCPLYISWTADAYLFRTFIHTCPDYLQELLLSVIGMVLRSVLSARVGVENPQPSGLRKVCQITQKQWRKCLKNFR